jgi:hypothetical protein
VLLSVFFALLFALCFFTGLVVLWLGVLADGLAGAGAGAGVWAKVITGMVATANAIASKLFFMVFVSLAGCSILSRSQFHGAAEAGK